MYAGKILQTSCGHRGTGAQTTKPGGGAGVGDGRLSGSWGIFFIGPAALEL